MSGIPWSTAISSSGSYTGVPSATFMNKQAMKNPRKVSFNSSKPQSNGSDEAPEKNGHLKDEISDATSRYKSRVHSLIYN